MTEKEIINEMMSFHNNEYLDWMRIERNDDTTKQELINYIKYNIEHLSSFLEQIEKS